MSTNKPPPDDHRVGAVKHRSQLKNKIEGEEHWTKRDKTPGQFMDQKADGRWEIKGRPQGIGRRADAPLFLREASGRFRGLALWSLQDVAKKLSVVRLD